MYGQGLRYSPFSYHMRLLLLPLYRSLGAFQPAIAHHNHLEIKQVGSRSKPHAGWVAGQAAAAQEAGEWAAGRQAADRLAGLSSSSCVVGWWLLNQ